VHLRRTTRDIGPWVLPALAALVDGEHRASMAPLTCSGDSDGDGGRRSRGMERLRGCLSLPWRRCSVVVCGVVLGRRGCRQCGWTLVDGEHCASMVEGPRNNAPRPPHRAGVHALDLPLPPPATACSSSSSSRWLWPLGQPGCPSKHARAGGGAEWPRCWAAASSACAERRHDRVVLLGRRGCRRRWTRWWMGSTAPQWCHSPAGAAPTAWRRTPSACASNTVGARSTGPSTRALSADHDCF
jgi:hypothetical protein